MGQNILRAFLVLSMLLPTSVFADELLIVDQPISLTFIPEAAYSLVEEGVGQIRNVKAEFSQSKGMRALEGTAREYLVATAINSSVPEVRAVFFIKGQSSDFAATPVKNYSAALLKLNSAGIDTLRERAAEVEARRDKVDSERQSIEGELLALRNQASKIAGLDELIDLKTELERLKEMGEQRSVERERLQKLIELSRTLPDLQEGDPRRAELSNDLRDIAQITAASERIQAEKRREAQASLEDKIARIKLAQKYSPEELARYVLKLRDRRRALEERLNISAPEDDL